MRVCAWRSGTGRGAAVRIGAERRQERGGSAGPRAGSPASTAFSAIVCANTRFFAFKRLLGLADEALRGVVLQLDVGAQLPVIDTVQTGGGRLQHRPDRAARPRLPGRPASSAVSSSAGSHLLRRLRAARAGSGSRLRLGTAGGAGRRRGDARHFGTRRAGASTSGIGCGICRVGRLDIPRRRRRHVERRHFRHGARVADDGSRRRRAARQHGDPDGNHLRLAYAAVAPIDDPAILHACGSRIRNVVPFPGVDCTSISPSCI